MLLLKYSDVNCSCKLDCPVCGVPDFWQSRIRGWCATCGYRKQRRPIKSCDASIRCPVDDELFAHCIGSHPSWRQFIAPQEVLLALYQSVEFWRLEGEPVVGLPVLRSPGFHGAHLVRPDGPRSSLWLEGRWISLNWPPQCSEIVGCDDLWEGLILRARSPNIIGGRAVLVRITPGLFKRRLPEQQ